MSFLDSRETQDENDQPEPGTRALVATLVATLASLFTYSYHLYKPDRSTDFGQIWYASRAIIAGLNPYELVGPGRQFEWDWILFYPATTFIAAIPFSWMTELWASLSFVWISAWLLANEITREGWHRLYLLASASFVVAAGAAQWSILFSAMLLLPVLALFISAKPNLGAAIGLVTSSSRTFWVGLGSTLVLLIVSLMMLPTWPASWMENVRQAEHMVAPVLRPGGFLILAALIRWRRHDALFLVLLGCIPQTGSWYETLPLLLIAHTRRECQILSMLSSVGFVATRYLVPLHIERQINEDMATLMVWFCYLPACWLVVTRANVGPPPAWWTLTTRMVRNESKSPGLGDAS